LIDAHQIIIRELGLWHGALPDFAMTARMSPNNGRRCDGIDAFCALFFNYRTSSALESQ
jgi:hypothetical protein